MHSPILIKENVIPRNIYVDYNLRLVAANRNKLLWGIVAGIGSLALVLNLYSYFLEKKPFPFTLCALIIFFALIYFGIPVRLRAHFGKIYDKTPAIGAPANFVLTLTQLEASTVFSRGETNWSAFIGAVEHQDWLMLHLNNRTFFAIDTRRLEPPAVLSDLYALLNQHTIPLGLAKVTKALSTVK